jgi:hypothetical protein
MNTQLSAIPTLSTAMPHHVYGVLDGGIHCDISGTVRGAKRYATLNGYTQISVRHNCGYTVAIAFSKLGGRWISNSDTKV